MPPAAALPLAVLLAAAAPVAQAGEVACWFENGAVVVPAMVGGVAGDYILDTGTAHTVLAETQAEAAGYADRALSVEVRLAGQRLVDHRVVVLDLDPRAFRFLTPIAGVIGADVLSAYVVDVSFAPCRVALHRPGHAPGFHAAVRLPMASTGEVPTVTASVADGPHARTGSFVVATGADTAVRIDDQSAQVPGAKHPEALLTYGLARPRLRALSLAGGLWEDLPGGLVAHEDLPPGALGMIGAPVLSTWRLRFDFPRRRLGLSPVRRAPPK